MPASAPDAGPFVCVPINAEWMQYVLGCLKQLMIPATWGDSRDPAVRSTLEAANDLIAIFIDATACAEGSVSGIYVGNCLTADLDLPLETETDVLTLEVQPGQYLLTARLGIFLPSGYCAITADLFDGTNVLAVGTTVVAEANATDTINISARIDVTAATTYTLRAFSEDGESAALAFSRYPTGTIPLVTCMEALPLGEQGDPGPTGPAGGVAELRFTASCGFEYSTDGGVTWQAVTGWLTNAPSCFAGFQGGGIPLSLIDPGNAPNPLNVDTNQQACNIAGYLAQTVIRGAVAEAHRQADLTNNALQFASGVLLLIPEIGLFASAFAQGAKLLYDTVESGTSSDFTDAGADETLWATMTCAIYAAIQADGEVTAANFAAVVAAVAGVSYVHADVITACDLFLVHLGVQNVRQAQQLGTVEVSDCSGCGGAGAWCTWWTPVQRPICNGDWVSITNNDTPTAAVCGPQGFGSVDNGDSGEYVVVEITLPEARTLTTCRVDYTAGALDDYAMTFYDAAGAVVFITGLTNWTAGTEGGPQYGVKRIMIKKGSGNSGFYLGSIKVGGPDSGSPWLQNNGNCD